MDATEEQMALNHVVERLSRTFPDVSAEDVQGAVTESSQSFDAARIRSFVPLLVEKDAREHLAHPEAG